jgi:hypothetical protein
MAKLSVREKKAKYLSARRLLMKSILRLILACSFASLICIHSAHAQVPVNSACLNGNIQQRQCLGRGCSQTWYQGTAGTTYENNGHSTYCCGSLVYDVGAEQNACTSGLLKTKESQIVLARLSTAGVRITVRSCQGRYVAYAPPATLPDPFKNSVVAVTWGHGGS